METNGNHFLLPKIAIDYFNISKLKKSNTNTVIYLKEN